MDISETGHGFILKNRGLIHIQMIFTIHDLFKLISVILCFILVLLFRNNFDRTIKKILMF